MKCVSLKKGTRFVLITEPDRTERVDLFAKISENKWQISEVIADAIGRLKLAAFGEDASPPGYCCRAASFSPTLRQLLLRRKSRQIPFYVARSVSMDPMSHPRYCYWGSRFA